jgi:hypothetical protein
MWNLPVDLTRPLPLLGTSTDAKVPTPLALCKTVRFVHNVVYPSGDVEKHSIAATILGQVKMAGDLMPFRRLKVAGPDCLPEGCL